MMINIQDSELEQLLHQPLSKLNMLNRVKQFSILDLPLGAYFLSAVLSLILLSISLSHL